LFFYVEKYSLRGENKRFIRHDAFLVLRLRQMKTVSLKEIANLREIVNRNASASQKAR
jgi:hypothetical protein